MLELFINDLAVMVQNGFSDMGERIDKVESRLNGVETGLDGVETRLDGVDNRLSNIDRRLDIVVSDHGQRIKLLEKAVA